MKSFQFGGQLATLGVFQLLFGGAWSLAVKSPRDLQEKDVVGDAVKIIAATTGTLEQLADQLTVDYLCLLAANPLSLILSPGEQISVPLACCDSSCKGPVCSLRKSCNTKTSTTASVTSSSTISVTITATSSSTVTPTSTSSTSTSSSSTTLTSSSSTSTTTTTSSSSSSSSTTTTTSSSSTATSPTTTQSPTSSSITSSSTITSAPQTTGDLTVTFTNAQSVAASIVFASNSGVPPPVSLTATTGAIAASATTVVVFPTGWAGNMVIGPGLNTNGSLFEASFNDPPSAPAVAMDVSYVNGYSVPIVCTCSGGNSGCNLDLFSLHSCPDLTQDGTVCDNPARIAPDGNGPVTDFFKPCQGAAFTFPNDTGANTNCADHNIQCCIGSSCAPDPKQTSS